MKQLCIFTLYPEKGASSQYRAYIFKDELGKHFEVKWCPFWNDRYVTLYMHNKRKYIIQIAFQYLFSSIKRMVQLYQIALKSDVVFIQKGFIPKSKRMHLRVLKKKNIRIVFDVDDAIYTIPKDNSNQIAELSDCVVCGNEILKSYYSQYCTNCIVIPTVENTYKYEPFWTDTFDKKIIGWIGSKTTINNFELIVDALNEVVFKHPEIKIAIISNTALDYTNRIKNAYLVPWQQDTYVNEIANFSIGIMPLQDNKMNRGKCGFKLIQYLNMKKPVIGSPVGVNEKIIEGNGYIASTKEEWVEALETLLYDKKVYNKCVEHIETSFFETYHYKNVVATLVDVLNK